MNIDYPHEIKQEKDLTEIQRRFFLPISEDEAKEQEPKTPEERQSFLQQRLAEMNARFEQARRKRE